ncbi:MAG: F0F1 ATP synthase subunit delta [Gammaproteobacteria bacterium]
MAEKITLARPYAQAVFDLARAEGAGGLKNWSEMLHLAATIASDPQMQSIIGNPRVSNDQLTQLFLDVSTGKLSDTGQNFIKLLIENHRLDVLVEIAALYEVQRAEAEGTLQAEVISAQPLSDEQQGTIAKALQARLGRVISLTCSIDKSLIGGVIVRAGDTVIDGSAREQLSRLSTALAR